MLSRFLGVAFVCFLPGAVVVAAVFRRMEYPDNFAGLASAVVDAGVDPESLLQFEECGVHCLSGAVCALKSHRLPPELSASLQAAL